MLRTAMIFGDNMIIQAGKLFTVWGTADAGKTVHVSFQDLEGNAEADAQGKWKVKLGTPVASRCEELKITCGDETICIRNAAVGEVWLAGGQSNMEFYMRYDSSLEETLLTVDNPDIRFFDYPEVCYEGQLDDYDYSRFGYWRSCDRENIEYYSAVAYYFARELQRKLDVPVGIIGCNWGGTTSSSWMSEESVRTAGAEWLADYEEQLSKLDIEAYKAGYKMNPVNDRTNPLTGFNEMALREVPREKQLEIMEKFGGMPTVVTGPMDPWRPACLYEYMVKPLSPYSIRGFLYYQGENDDPKAHLFEKMMTALIHDWRALWGEELPFLFVQLPPFETWLESTAENYPVLRGAQAAVSKKVPSTWLAAAGDVGMRYDIHPKNKKPVGERLAFLAENHVYGLTDVKCDAPEPEKVTRDGDTTTICFRNVEQFDLKGDKPEAVEIYEEGKTIPEDEYRIKVSGSSWAVTSDRLTSQKLTLKFAETNYYEMNIFNEAGIPVKPFTIEI